MLHEKHALCNDLTETLRIEGIYPKLKGRHSAIMKSEHGYTMHPNTTFTRDGGTPPNHHLEPFIESLDAMLSINFVYCTP
jgi:hypothetical protein